MFSTQLHVVAGEAEAVIAVPIASTSCRVAIAGCEVRHGFFCCPRAALLHGGPRMPAGRYDSVGTQGGERNNRNQLDSEGALVRCSAACRCADGGSP